MFAWLGPGSARQIFVILQIQAGGLTGQCGCLVRLQPLSDTITACVTHENEAGVATSSSLVTDPHGVERCPLVQRAAGGMADANAANPKGPMAVANRHVELNSSGAGNTCVKSTIRVMSRFG